MKRTIHGGRRAIGSRDWPETLDDNGLRESGEDRVTGRVDTIARRGGERNGARQRPSGGVVDHLVLLKPRVMSLVVFTGAVGFLLAPRAADSIGFWRMVSAIAAGAGACGALEDVWWDADIDANMSRTAMRPIPRGKGAVPPDQALAIGALLAAVSVAALEAAS